MKSNGFRVLLWAIFPALIVFIGYGASAKADDPPENAPGAHDTPGSGEANAQGLTAAQALERLIAGNKRFMAGKSSSTHRTSQRREAVGQAQHPIAIVVTCADSRVAPEILFDEGIGDLFVIRVAGNIVDDFELGSIEYAAEHLHVPLVIVLGHERCGAVSAALAEGTPEGHVGALVEAIRPHLSPEALKAMDLAVRENAKAVALEIAASEPVLKPMAQKGDLTVVAGSYDLDSGQVEWLK